MNDREATPDRAAGAPDTGGADAVVARDLEKRFGGLTVLDGVSLNARAGGIVSIIGASGSGKSTLLRCMNLLEQPDGGDLTIAGEHLRFGQGQPGVDRKQVQRLRASVSMVFQQSNLWPHMTVLGNVIAAPVHVLGVDKHEAVERADALLAKVGLADKREAYPAFLSGGQQQRAGIARALAMQPRVLLFDEPTSALDPELVGEVLGVIRDLAGEGRTMMLVTHEMKFAREVSHEVIFLHNGRVEEKGAPAKVFDRADSERCRQFVSAVA